MESGSNQTFERGNGYSDLSRRYAARTLNELPYALYFMVFENGWNVMIRTKPQEGLKLIKEEGQVSFQYAKKEPRPAFVFQIDKPTEESVRFVTVVIPYENGQIPKVSTILPEW